MKPLIAIAAAAVLVQHDQRALDLQHAGRWAQARAAWAGVADDDAVAQLQLGVCCVRDGDLESAVEAFERVVAGSPRWRGVALLEIATVHVLRGESADAIDTLELALQAGVRGHNSIRVREEWDGLADDPRVVELLAPLRPRRSTPFDFVLGHWDVDARALDDSGQWRELPPGRHRFVRELDGAGFREEWHRGDDHGVAFLSRVIDAPTWRIFATDTEHSGRQRYWTGGIRGDTAVFTGGDTVPKTDGAPRSRIAIRDITADSFHWELQRAADGGPWTPIEVRDYHR